MLNHNNQPSQNHHIHVDLGLLDKSALTSINRRFIENDIKLNIMITNCSVYARIGVQCITRMGYINADIKILALRISNILHGIENKKLTRTYKKVFYSFDK